MSDNRRSRAITEGVERTPNRAMLRAVGFRDKDFTKAIIGVANGYSTITPCNMGLNDLADQAIASLRAAGTMPQVFGTITVSDGISMGTEGMRYSLVSREVIADSIETVCQAQRMDGLLAIGGCDKNMPGAMIAIARMNIPAIFVYGGTIRPGRYQGRDLTIVSAFEAVGSFERADDRQIAALVPSGADRAAVDEDRRNVHPGDGDHRARHVLVAAANGQQAVHALGRTHRLDRVGDDLAGDEAVAHSL